MYKKVKAELTELTPELASYVATLPSVPGERPLKPSRLKFFEEHLRAGTFAGPTWTIGLCRHDSRTYRLDGQHTSTVLATLPREKFPQGQVALVVTYEFDDLDKDATYLFEMFDNPKAARNNEDRMGYDSARYPDLLDVPLKLRVKITNGLYEYEKSIKGRELPARLRGLYFSTEHYRAFAHFLHMLSDTGRVVNGFMFGKAGIVAEMFLDWHTDAPSATGFWGDVLTERHPDRDHVTRELAEQFKIWNQAVKKPDQEDYRLRAHKFWQRFRKELELERRRREEPPLPSAA